MSWFSRNRTPLVVLLVAALLLAVGGWGLYSSEGAARARERDDRLAQARGAGPRNGEAEATLEVAVVTVRRATAAEVVELSGVLEPLRSTWVAAELAGRLVEIPAQEHMPIEAGGLLARLDPALPRAELIRAQASHRLAKQQLERQQRLGQRSVSSEAELERAQAEERRSYAALLEARTRLSHTEIEAPFAGLVNELALDPGAFVQPGTRIAEVLDVATLEVSVPVSDRQVGAIRPGQAVQVRIDPLGNAIVDGRIERVGGAPQARSQRYPVVVRLANPEGRLRPGMLAYVRLEVGTASAIRLPALAVEHEFELSYVYAVDADGRTARTRIATRPVAFRPDQIEVLSGLSDGDRVAISAVARLRDGMRVRTR